MTAKPEGLDMTTLTDEQWYDLAQRHASANWNDFGYMDAVKALCADYSALLSASKPAAPQRSGVEHFNYLCSLLPEGFHWSDPLTPDVLNHIVSATAPAQSGDDVRERIARALHYPPCWDTAAYPTLESAMLESLGDFMCTTCLDKIAAPQPSQTAVVLDDGCPHAAPFRYCPKCPVTPCPIGLGEK